jgi:hypothetical protein
MMLGMHGCFPCIEEYEIFFICMFTKISYCHKTTQQSHKKKRVEITNKLVKIRFKIFESNRNKVNLL